MNRRGEGSGAALLNRQQGWQEGGAHVTHGGDANTAWSPRPRHTASDEVVKVGASLGRIWADLDLGPKTRIDLYLMLSNFYQEYTVIGVMD